MWLFHQLHNVRQNKTFPLSSKSHIKHMFTLLYTTLSGLSILAPKGLAEVLSFLVFQSHVFTSWANYALGQINMAGGV